MRQTLYVVNPNSSRAVTAGIDAALAPLRRDDGPRIECVTLEDGPPGVQSQLDVDRAALAVHRFAQAHRAEAAGFVTACFSDPGLHLAREKTARPVLGINECGLLTALALGRRVGVIAILPTLMGRHARGYAAARIRPDPRRRGGD